MVIKVLSQGLAAISGKIRLAMRKAQKMQVSASKMNKILLATLVRSRIPKAWVMI